MRGGGAARRRREKQGQEPAGLGWAPCQIRKDAVARLELLSGFWRVEAAGSLRCVGVAVLVQFPFANPVMCLRGLVCGSSQLTVELERADVGTVLIAYAAGTERLVHNG